MECWDCGLVFAAEEFCCSCPKCIPQRARCQGMCGAKKLLTVVTGDFQDLRAFCSRACADADAEEQEAEAAHRQRAFVAGHAITDLPAFPGTGAER